MNVRTRRRLEIKEQWISHKIDTRYQNRKDKGLKHKRNQQFNKYVSI